MPETSLEQEPVRTPARTTVLRFRRVRAKYAAVRPRGHVHGVIHRPACPFTGCFTWNRSGLWTSAVDDGGPRFARQPEPDAVGVRHSLATLSPTIWVNSRSRRVSVLWLRGTLLATAEPFTLPAGPRSPACLLTSARWTPALAGRAGRWSPGVVETDYGVGLPGRYLVGDERPYRRSARLRRRGPGRATGSAAARGSGRSQDHRRAPGEAWTPRQGRLGLDASEPTPRCRAGGCRAGGQPAGRHEPRRDPPDPGWRRRVWSRTCGVAAGVRALEWSAWPGDPRHCPRAGPPPLQDAERLLEPDGRCRRPGKGS